MKLPIRRCIAIKRLPEQSVYDKTFILLIVCHMVCSLYKLIFRVLQPENPWSLDRGMNGVRYREHIFTEIQYIYEAECVQRNLNTDNALALDLGINNLVTAVSSNGKSFIIDGRRLKSINQWFNKENTRLQSIKDKQHFGKKATNRQKAIARDRNNKVNDYMNKAARKVIDYCINNDIGTLVAGYNETFQCGSHMGKQNNQNFVNIPYGQLRSKLEYLSELNGIIFVKQEESYTSKSSFWDKDDIPVYNTDNPKEYQFSGNRVHRGLYKTADGRTLNADVNGALNIMKKSSVVDMNILYGRGEVDTPVRIRIA